MISRWRLREGNKRARRLIRLWNAGSDEPFKYNIGYFRSTRCKCSNWCCGNKRKNFGITVQERRWLEKSL